MIHYDEDYLIKLIFRYNGSVGPRALLFAIPAGLITVILLVCNDQVHNFFTDTGIDAITGSQSWAAVTGVLVLLLSFRTRQALSRFWEGTGLLHQMRGEWFDSVSCCVTFSRAALDTKKQEVMDFRHTLVRLMSLCHGSALEEIADDVSLSTIDLTGLDNMTIAHLKECKEKHDFNRVEVILHLIQTLITKNLDKGVLKIPAPILSRVYQTLSRGFVNLLNAKKITDTRFPFPYAQLISILLILHTVLTPVMISELISHKAWAFVFSLVPIFGMFSLNFTASQLENPFGNDDNDLPLEHFQDEMNASLLMLLHTNSDHIAGISEDAELDFEELAKSIRDESEGAVPRVGLLPSVMTVAFDGEERKVTNGESCTVVAEKEDAGASAASAGGNGQAAPAAPRGDEEAAKPESDRPAQPPVQPPAPAQPATAPRSPRSPREAASRPPPSAQHRLLSTMDDFNMALQSWTKTVDRQIGELSQNFADLRRISDTVPALIEAIQAARRENGHSKLEDDSALLSSLKAFPAI